MIRQNILLPRYPVCLIHGLKNIFHFVNYWHGTDVFLREHGIEVYELNTYWRGPQPKRVNDLAKKLSDITAKHKKVHVFAHSLGTLDSLVLSQRPELKNKIASLTLISPLTGGTPWAEIGAPLMPWLKDVATPPAAEKILRSFESKEKDVFVSAIIANPKFACTAKVMVQKALLTRILKSRNMDPQNDGLIPLRHQETVKRIAKHVIYFPGDHVQVVGGGPWPRGEKTAQEVYLNHCIFLAERDLQNAE